MIKQNCIITTYYLHAATHICITSSLKSPANCETSWKEWENIVTGDTCCDWIIVHSFMIPAEQPLPLQKKLAFRQNSYNESELYLLALESGPVYQIIHIVTFQGESHCHYQFYKAIFPVFIKHLSLHSVSPFHFIHSAIR